ncbi:AraC family transcriptional regulator InvF [Burkholderia ubonensis]|uniref:AraC family transcriptional regulator InvF n=1 Tax=Burkholderia ubonensis TaxID=101571 RepID=UPI0022B76A6B|nr:AraC family transcriptional regulator InvF [Burkholderia ubonensis]
MMDHEVLNSQEALCSGVRRSVPAQEAWLLQLSPDQKACLELTWKRGSESWEAPDGWQGILLLDRVEVRVAAGELRVRPLKLKVFSKLLAFIDEANGVEAAGAEFTAWSLLSHDEPLVWQERKRCEYWFLLQMLEEPASFSPFLALLRHSESYWLVRFLLAQSTGSNTLQDLGQRYGVSYSHFRRLCRHALGSAAKTELRDWRMARSMLDVAEGRESLTQVALKHGYASSSHFSTEIKGLLGMSPRSLSNIIQLATE